MTDWCGCTFASAVRAESSYATTSRIQRWILLEQPGPWGRNAVLESRLPDAAARQLWSLGHRLGARVLLLRRHGRAVRHGPVAAYAAVTFARRSWIESFTLDRPEDVLDLNLEGLRHGAPVGGSPMDEPLFLVCTNGRHDPCCAVYGRPLAAALSQAFGDAVWECSHIGGDRFAGNLLCFPHGICYGRLAPKDAVGVAKLHREGFIDLGHYRGRSAYSFPVQAAEYFIRREQRLNRIQDLGFISAEEQGEDHWSVGFDGQEWRYTAVVRTWPDPSAEFLTCHASTPYRAPRYELRSLEASRR